MRHTLLPYPDRKMLRREYRTRVLIVLCFMLSAAGVIGIGSLFPSFIRATTEERTQVDLIDTLKKGKETSGLTQIEKELAADNILLSALMQEPNSLRASEIIAPVVAARGPVRIGTIAIISTASSSVSIGIQGIAPTRESLLSLKTRLEGLKPGNIVDLPISELAKSVNIDFSLQLTQSLP